MPATVSDVLNAVQSTSPAILSTEERDKVLNERLSG